MHSQPYVLGPVYIHRLSAWKPASVAFDDEQGSPFYPGSDMILLYTPGMQVKSGERIWKKMKLIDITIRVTEFLATGKVC